MASTRRQPLLTENLTSPKKSSSNVGEVAGVTTANCVAVCCCCPCILVEFIIMVVYKVPVNLCRRMLRRRRKMMKRKKMKKGLLEEAKEVGSGVSEVYYKTGFVDEFSDVYKKEFEMIKVSVDGSTVELERKMWEQFHDTGFWRSSSQRFS
ncbi:uncharacterized protein LOC110688571 [Chenopodium quinoa]|uniref:uncharacterized protein LOC110688571 n=1 Tax=Chenopodium quinoa TaxID=63459 RepID=UPI000B778AD9|nr:uncharacterized protein LOC110688571 [Chenopodium quinoa]